MAFPTTGILDNFNRDNEGPPLSANWTSTGVGGLKVISNVAAGNTSGDNVEAYTAASYAANSEAYCTIATMVGSDEDIALFVRADLVNGNAYEVSYTNDVDDGHVIRFYRLDAMDDIKLGADIVLGFTPEAGDKIGIKVVGSVIEAWAKDGAASWTLIGSRTDATYSTGGYLGLKIFATTARVEDFGGGSSVGGVMTTNSKFWG